MHPCLYIGVEGRQHGGIQKWNAMKSGTNSTGKPWATTGEWTPTHWKLSISPVRRGRGEKIEDLMTQQEPPHFFLPPARPGSAASCLQLARTQPVPLIHTHPLVSLARQVAQESCVSLDRSSFSWFGLSLSGHSDVYLSLQPQSR
jgi:hypothetical protein